MNSEDRQLLNRLDGFLDATMMCLSDDTLGKVTYSASATLIAKQGNLIDSLLAHWCFEDELLSVSDVRIEAKSMDNLMNIDLTGAIQQQLPTATQKQERLAWHIMEMLRILTEEKDVISVGQYYTACLVTFHNDSLQYREAGDAFVVELADEFIALCFDKRCYLKG